MRTLELSKTLNPAVARPNFFITFLVLCLTLAYNKKANLVHIALSCVFMMGLTIYPFSDNKDYPQLRGLLLTNEK